MAWKAANILEGAYRQKANLINFSIADREKIEVWLKMNVTIRPTAACGAIFQLFLKTDVHQWGAMWQITPRVNDGGLLSSVGFPANNHALRGGYSPYAVLRLNLHADWVRQKPPK